MNTLFKIAGCLLCSNFSKLKNYCKKKNTSQLLSKQCLAMPTPVALSKFKVKPSAIPPAVKFTVFETFNLYQNNKHAAQHINKAVLNFSSQHLDINKVTGAPIAPSSPLLHDVSHTRASPVHTGNALPLLFKFTLYL